MKLKFSSLSRISYAAPWILIEYLRDFACFIMRIEIDNVCKYYYNFKMTKQEMRKRKTKNENSIKFTLHLQILLSQKRKSVINPVI